jgi:DNA repair protein RadC
MPSRQGVKMLDEQIHLAEQGRPSPGNASDLELLRQLIGVQESTRLYRGSLGPFFVDSPHGSPPEKCTVARELVKRWLSEQLQSRPAFENPEAVSDFLKIHFAGREYESFVVLFLDAQNRLISAQELFRGTLTQTSVYPREIVKAALSQNAACVMFSHNHPSGVPQPSRADEALTQTLKAALALVDVRVLDHLVIAGNRSLSFAETGLL